MTTAMASALINKLRHLSIRISVDQDRIHLKGSVRALTPELFSAITAHKEDLLELLRCQDADQPLDGASVLIADLRERIRYAQFLTELGHLVQQVDLHVERNQLSDAAAGELAMLAVRTSRRLEAGRVNVPAEALIGP